jgi:WD40 repeat protein
LNEYVGHKVDQFTIDVAFSKQDSYIFSGSVDGKLYIYDIMRKTPLKTIEAHQKTLSTVCVHEAAGIVTGGHDGSLFYYKV